eukprot:NODE_222_length_1981_cov_269.368530_g177_i0.p1 GENE.NODE_222_length_1981_cov_269.368530_g177_i0~~NODE_222_length_1981_cov_269.368530_g177_i0.p1  ORF type:complete len:599 (-),score=150.69 NODE_222_length_1981_cov_269.368530_g177_i0:74-1870(-)
MLRVLRYHRRAACYVQMFCTVPILEEIADPRLRVAIVGRPNVGKSTLFNRLVGKHKAIASKLPGVTRDCVECPAAVLDCKFTAIDTPGMDENSVMEHTVEVVRTADVSLFLIDVKTGVTEMDLRISQFLRDNNHPSVLILNKCDTLTEDIPSTHTMALNYAQRWKVSAEQSLGLDDLYGLLRKLVRARENRLESMASGADATATATAATTERPKPSRRSRTGTPLDYHELLLQGAIRLTILGAQNVGKSTLFNRLLGKNRSQVSPTKGTTRDSVEIRCMYKNRKILLADTAGMMKRKFRQMNKLDAAAYDSAVATLKFSNVIILVIDASKPIRRIDLKIANQAVREGRCLVLAANKWDTVLPQSRLGVAEALEERIQTSFRDVSGITCVVCSAERGANVKLLVEKAIDLADRWSILIPNGDLANWYSRLQVASAIALPAGAELLQVSIRPPTFELRVPKTYLTLPDNHKRYLVTQIREEFGFHGIPIRISQRVPSKVWNVGAAASRKKGSAPGREWVEEQRQKDSGATDSFVKAEEGGEDVDDVFPGFGSLRKPATRSAVIGTSKAPAQKRERYSKNRIELLRRYQADKRLQKRQSAK